MGLGPTLARVQGSERVPREIRRANLRQCSAEEKIHIVLEGLSAEGNIGELGVR
jgi:hypothetical protein